MGTGRFGVPQFPAAALRGLLETDPSRSFLAELRVAGNQTRATEFQILIYFIYLLFFCQHLGKS